VPKPSHWTYTLFEADDDIYQGDIIGRTPELLDILQDSHKYFCDEKYLCFVVVTQSCDLVLRGKKGQGSCKARQIALCVVRAMDQILFDVLSDVCGTDARGIYRQEAKLEAKLFLERVINQNEQAHGLFYLHPDAAVGISEPAVAMLRVSIALKSDHYEILKAARVGRLDSEFRNKLGWLTGNLYSRIDTRDWADQPADKKIAQKLVSNLLNRTGAEQENVWVPDTWLRRAAQAGVDIRTIDRADAHGTLKKYAPPTPLDTALGRVRTQTVDVIAAFSERQQQRLVEILRSDEVSVAIASSKAGEIAYQVLGRWPQLNNLATDPRLRDALVSRVSVALSTSIGPEAPRDINAVLAVLGNALLFDAGAFDAVCDFIAWDGLDATMVTTAKTALAQRLEETKIPASLLSHLQSLAYLVAAETLAERLAARLLNDISFTGTLASQ
jgi:hypothetical protein